MIAFPNYKQLDHKDCGPTCIKIIAKYYGKDISLPLLRQLCSTTRTGSSLLNLSDAAESIGFKTVGIRTSFVKLHEEVLLPCIIHWSNNHYIVVYRIKKNKVYISDPDIGLHTLSIESFVKGWIGNNSTLLTEEGVALIVEPAKDFYFNEWDIDKSGNFSYIYKYLIRYRKLLVQLIIGLFAASILQLVFPFLTQSIVDIGIQNQDIEFIYLILFAQLMIFIGSTTIEIIRGWVLLHLSTRVTVSLISDFFIKLMNLPISFFDTKVTGDLMQRINDHKRIENLITNSSLSTLFSLTNILVFSFVLAYYNIQIFLVFLLGTILNLTWVIIFLHKRRLIDHAKFTQFSREQSKVMELINGMQEIKLHNAEKQNRWSWEYIQAAIFKISMKALAVEQSQSVGSLFIDQIKNMIITVISATLVVKGSISLGMMLSIQFIIGQLSTPINQIVNFIRSAQDAKISFDRLREIHEKSNEEEVSDHKETKIDINKDIFIDNLSFRYIGCDEPVIRNLSFSIPTKRITAIVGASGSGKTTLMKLLLKFYKPEKGDIKLGEINLEKISQKVWRQCCGVVMQEGFIFNDTIAKNIVVNDEIIDKDKLERAVKVSSIGSFIESLPKGFNTKIGSEGVGISTGQKQRILIARAVYKNPDIIFFDEATSSLDANNERTIMENLNRFFDGKTAIIIAHRLSTVKNAHQIVVLDNGTIVETGTHDELVGLKGYYYTLVKNQLELDKLTQPIESLVNA